MLIKNGKLVSKLEYTKNNYDNNGNLIDEAIPTITTNYCEIGLYDREIYFVFILESQTFNKTLFNSIKSIPNIYIYGFEDFNKTLYPSRNFNYNDFVKTIRQDKYLQVKFSFENIKVVDLYKIYCDLVDVFDKNNAKVINQLKINLAK